MFKPCCSSPGCYCAWGCAVAMSAGQTMAGGFLVGNEKEAKKGMF